MKFKREHMKNEFWKLNVKLQYIVFDIALFVKLNFKKEIVITSIYRPYDGKHHSVHNVWRGVDIRTKNLTKDEITAVETYINKRYIYDPTRTQYKCCLYHNVGYGWHFHTQVHYRTKITV